MYLYSAQRVMWFKVVLLVLFLSLLGLGAAQECEGFVGVLGMTPDQLKKEIRANVAAALTWGVINSSGNGSCVTWEELNTTLERAVGIATATEEVIVNISKSFEQLVSPILTQLYLLRLPGSTPSHPGVSCKEIKELSLTAPSGSGAQVTPLFTCTVT